MSRPHSHSTQAALVALLVVLLVATPAMWVSAATCRQAPLLPPSLTLAPHKGSELRTLFSLPATGPDAAGNGLRPVLHFAPATTWLALAIQPLGDAPPLGISATPHGIDDGLQIVSESAADRSQRLLIELAALDAPDPILDLTFDRPHTALPALPIPSSRPIDVGSLPLFFDSTDAWLASVDAVHQVVLPAQPPTAPHLVHTYSFTTPSTGASELGLSTTLRRPEHIGSSLTLVVAKGIITSHSLATCTQSDACTYATLLAASSGVALDVVLESATTYSLALLSYAAGAARFACPYPSTLPLTLNASLGVEVEPGALAFATYLRPRLHAPTTTSWLPSRSGWLRIHVTAPPHVTPLIAVSYADASQTRRSVADELLVPVAAGVDVSLTLDFVHHAPTELACSPAFLRLAFLPLDVPPTDCAATPRGLAPAQLAHRLKDGTTHHDAIEMFALPHGTSHALPFTLSTRSRITFELHAVFALVSAELTLVLASTPHSPARRLQVSSLNVNVMTDVLEPGVYTVSVIAPSDPGPANVTCIPYGFRVAVDPMPATTPLCPPHLLANLPHTLEPRLTSPSGTAIALDISLRLPDNIPVVGEVATTSHAPHAKTHFRLAMPSIITLMLGPAPIDVDVRLERRSHGKWIGVAEMAERLGLDALVAAVEADTSYRVVIDFVAFPDTNYDPDSERCASIELSFHSLPLAALHEPCCCQSLPPAYSLTMLALPSSVAPGSPFSLGSTFVALDSPMPIEIPLNVDSDDTYVSASVASDLVRTRASIELINLDSEVTVSAGLHELPATLLEPGTSYALLIRSTLIELDSDFVPECAVLAFDLSLFAVSAQDTVVDPMFCTSLSLPGLMLSGPRSSALSTVIDLGHAGVQYWAGMARLPPSFTTDSPMSHLYTAFHYMVVAVSPPSASLRVFVPDAGLLDLDLFVTRLDPAAARSDAHSGALSPRDMCVHYSTGRFLALELGSTTESLVLDLDEGMYCLEIAFSRFDFEQLDYSACLAAWIEIVLAAGPVLADTPLICASEGTMHALPTALSLGEPLALALRLPTPPGSVNASTTSTRAVFTTPRTFSGVALIHVSYDVAMGPWVPALTAVHASFATPNPSRKLITPAHAPGRVVYHLELAPETRYELSLTDPATTHGTWPRLHLPCAQHDIVGGIAAPGLPLPPATGLPSCLFGEPMPTSLQRGGWYIPPMVGLPRSAPSIAIPLTSSAVVRVVASWEPPLAGMALTLRASNSSGPRLAVSQTFASRDEAIALVVSPSAWGHSTLTMLELGIELAWQLDATDALAANNCPYVSLQSAVVPIRVMAQALDCGNANGPPFGDPAPIALPPVGLLADIRAGASVHFEASPDGGHISSKVLTSWALAHPDRREKWAASFALDPQWASGLETLDLDLELAFPLAIALPQMNVVAVDENGAEVVLAASTPRSLVMLPEWPLDAARRLQVTLRRGFSTYRIDVSVPHDDISVNLFLASFDSYCIPISLSIVGLAVPTDSPPGVELVSVSPPSAVVELDEDLVVELVFSPPGVAGPADAPSLLAAILLHRTVVLGDGLTPLSAAIDDTDPTRMVVVFPAATLAPGSIYPLSLVVESLAVAGDLSLSPKPYDGPLPVYTTPPCFCYGHGSCTVDGLCQCKPPYAGDHCLECQSGWVASGDACLPATRCPHVASAADICSGHGYCDDASGLPRCVCSPGYARLSLDPARLECSACAPGFSGFPRCTANAVDPQELNLACAGLPLPTVVEFGFRVTYRYDTDVVSHVMAITPLLAAPEPILLRLRVPPALVANVGESTELVQPCVTAAVVQLAQPPHPGEASSSRQDSVVKTLSSCGSGEGSDADASSGPHLLAVLLQPHTSYELRFEFSAPEDIDVDAVGAECSRVRLSLALHAISDLADAVELAATTRPAATILPPRASIKFPINDAWVDDLVYTPSTADRRTMDDMPVSGIMIWSSAFDVPALPGMLGRLNAHVWFNPALATLDLVVREASLAISSTIHTGASQLEMDLPPGTYSLELWMSSAVPLAVSTRTLVVPLGLTIDLGVAEVNDQVIPLVAQCAPVPAFPAHLSPEMPALNGAFLAGLRSGAGLPLAETSHTLAFADGAPTVVRVETGYHKELDIDVSVIGRSHMGGEQVVASASTKGHRGESLFVSPPSGVTLTGVRLHVQSLTSAADPCAAFQVYVATGYDAVEPRPCPASNSLPGVVQAATSNSPLHAPFVIAPPRHEVFWLVSKVVPEKASGRETLASFTFDITDHLQLMLEVLSDPLLSPVDIVLYRHVDGADSRPRVMARSVRSGPSARIDRRSLKPGLYEVAFAARTAMWGARCAPVALDLRLGAPSIPPPLARRLPDALVEPWFELPGLRPAVYAWQSDNAVLPTPGLGRDSSAVVHTMAITAVGPSELVAIAAAWDFDVELVLYVADNSEVPLFSAVSDSADAPAALRLALDPMLASEYVLEIRASSRSDGRHVVVDGLQLALQLSPAARAPTTSCPPSAGPSLPTQVPFAPPDWPFVLAPAQRPFVLAGARGGGASMDMPFTVTSKGTSLFVELRAPLALPLVVAVYTSGDERLVAAGRLGVHADITATLSVPHLEGGSYLLRVSEPSQASNVRPTCTMFGATVVFASRPEASAQLPLWQHDAALHAVGSSGANGWLPIDTEGSVFTRFSSPDLVLPMSVAQPSVLSMAAHALCDELECEIPQLELHQIDSDGTRRCLACTTSDGAGARALAMLQPLPTTYEVKLSGRGLVGVEWAAARLDAVEDWARALNRADTTDEVNHPLVDAAAGLESLALRAGATGATLPRTRIRVAPGWGRLVGELPLKMTSGQPGVLEASLYYDAEFGALELELVGVGGSEVLEFEHEYGQNRVVVRGVMAGHGEYVLRISVPVWADGEKPTSLQRLGFSFWLAADVLVDNDDGQSPSPCLPTSVLPIGGIESGAGEKLSFVADAVELSSSGRLSSWLTLSDEMMVMVMVTLSDDLVAASHGEGNAVGVAPISIEFYAEGVTLLPQATAYVGGQAVATFRLAQGTMQLSLAYDAHLVRDAECATVALAVEGRAAGAAAVDALCPVLGDTGVPSKPQVLKVGVGGETQAQASFVASVPLDVQTLVPHRIEVPIQITGSESQARVVAAIGFSPFASLLEGGVYDGGRLVAEFELSPNGLGSDLVARLDTELKAGLYTLVANAVGMSDLGLRAPLCGELDIDVVVTLDGAQVVAAVSPARWHELRPGLGFVVRVTLPSVYHQLAASDVASAFALDVGMLPSPEEARRVDDVEWELGWGANQIPWPDQPSALSEFGLVLVPGSQLEGIELQLTTSYGAVDCGGHGRMDPADAACKDGWSGTTCEVYSFEAETSTQAKQELGGWIGLVAFVVVLLGVGGGAAWSLHRSLRRARQAHSFARLDDVEGAAELEPLSDLIDGLESSIEGEVGERVEAGEAEEGSHDGGGSDGDIGSGSSGSGATAAFE
ncbi:uncharacterized protein AMSG_07653 [Thecamonas trahens ATCC 50062]|uniref:EGF-like domain-containing protein n=1 Tax=Thecamonas trahens ATCC 50062 TaxID=461836 RepID=A0A0L0DJH9_THETB|nr:hypothetical protein AMSG_07653 [Thecamonas trahens ATCC 50062]KNC51458.1 hypothetical protein AMSG_07653 [Thecamonas trahens ATCC 50062]|eukprot:XP_013756120.1 hypothetical protein AMSG_07653 [Thecamonas trahens ATCC 50062]